MTRQVTLHNVGTHADLEFTLPDAGPVLVTGENSSGKTTIARCLAAVMAQHTNPAGLSAAQTKAYLMRGTTEGHVAIEGGPTWRVPAKMEVPAGCDPETTAHVAGIVDFVRDRTNDAAQAAVYEALFLPDDPKMILEPVWKHGSRQLAQVLNLIHRDGWAKAASIYDAHKVDYGRAWCKVTGESRYTKKKASTWKPDDWTVDLEGASEEDVLAALTDAQDAIRATTVRQAVDQDRIDRGINARDVLAPAQQEVVDKLEASARTLATEVIELREKVNTAKAPAKALEAEIAEKEKELGAARHKLANPPVDEPDGNCPWCHEPIRVHWDKMADHAELTKFTEHTPNLTFLEQSVTKLATELPKLRDDFEKAKAEFDRLAAEYTEKREAAHTANTTYQQEIGKLRLLEDQAKDAELEPSESNDAERSQLENERDRANARRLAWVANRDAAQAHDNYVEYEAIAKLLGPAGARAGWMKERMDIVRKALERICEITDWLPITISEGYEVMSDGLPMAMVADNERRKCQWAVQVALCMTNKAARVVILDAADLLRGQHWKGLETLVERICARKKDLLVVVCATETMVPAGWSHVSLERRP